MGFMDKAKQAAQNAQKEGGLIDKAKKAADQAQAKLDEKQKGFNDKQSQDARERHEAAQAAPETPPAPQGPPASQAPPPPAAPEPPATPGEGGSAPADAEPGPDPAGNAPSQS